MENLNVTQILTEKELNNFFSGTDEYTVEKISENKYKIHCEGDNSIIYKPTIQTLIRHLHTYGYYLGSLNK